MLLTTTRKVKLTAVKPGEVSSFARFFSHDQGADMSVITPVIRENTVLLGHVNLSPYLVVSDLHITTSISRHIQVSAGQVLSTVVPLPHPETPVSTGFLMKWYITPLNSSTQISIHEISKLGAVINRIKKQDYWSAEFNIALFLCQAP